MIYAVNVSNIAALAVAVIAVVGVGVAAFFSFRSRDTIKAAQGAAGAWKEERDAEVAKSSRLEALIISDRDVATARNDRLEALVVSEREKRVQVEIELAKCNERTDLKPLLDMQRELQDETVRAFKELSGLITARFGEQSILLQAMTKAVVDRLDPTIHQTVVTPPLGGIQ